MKSLVALFEELGAREVRTYIQSGNVIYGATTSEAKTLPLRAARAIEAEFGFAVPVVGRSLSQWRKILAANPWPEAVEEPKTLHLGLLDRKPSASAAAKLDPERSPGDRYVLKAGELYLLCPKGVARTKLTCAYFDKTLARVSTMRNWRTATKLLDLGSC